MSVPNTPSLAISGQRFNGTVGALALANLVAMLLLGLFLGQVYFYFWKFPNHPKFAKSIVGLLVIFEIGHTITSTHGFYVTNVSVSDFSLSEEPHRLPDSMNVMILFEGLITLLVQAFFAFRLYRFMRRQYIAHACGALAIVRFCLTLALSLLGFFVAYLDTYLNKYKPLWIALLIVGAFVDITITTAVSLVFRSSRRVITSTTRIHDQVVVWTISNGLLTSILSIVTVTFFMTLPVEDLWWFTVYTWLAKLHSNSILAFLILEPAVEKEGQNEAYAISNIQIHQQNSSVITPVIEELHR